MIYHPRREVPRVTKIASQSTPNSIVILHNVGMGIYFEWNAQVHTKSYAEGRPDAAETAPNCSKGKAVQLLFLLVLKGAWATNIDWTSSLVISRSHRFL